MEKIKSLSLIVPAYKQEETIATNIQFLDSTLSKLFKDYEIIVVVDGFTDNTYDIVQKIKIKYKKLRVFGYKENQGKGYAVKYGMLRASKSIIGFIDAGLDIEPDSVSDLIKYLETNKADIVIGSKLHPKSKVKYPLIRKILSRGYREIVHFLFDLSVKDTQAGLKLFRKEVAKKVFEKVRVKNFAFDIEALVLAKSMGFNKIYEAPVKLSFRKGTITHLNFFIISVETFIDTLKIFWRLRIKHEE